MSISIYTITHVPFTPPEDPVYVPLQVGCAAKPDYGYLKDNTGDNISAKNSRYSELTGLYWIWKNHADTDYIGLCHYRRYFLNNAGELMTQADYLELLSKYDVIIARPQTGEHSYRTVYERAHDIHNLEQTGLVLRELYPEYDADFQEIIAGNRCYVGNLFVAPKALFCAYCQWLFTLFQALESRIRTDNLNDYHKRVFGFLSEQLLFVWIRHNHLSFYESPYGLSQEKAETIAFKESLGSYIQQKDIDGAYRHLNAVLDKRPDLSLELSDFHQELKTIEHIINICRIEQEASLPSLLTFSCDLTTLVRHVRLLLSILEHIQDSSVSKEELQYLTDCRVSHKALVYLLQNFPQALGSPVEMLNRLAVIYSNAGENLTSLSFLEEALSLQENNKTTLTNIITALQRMGQYDMAAEYEQYLHTAVSSQRFAVFTGSGIPILDYIAEQYRKSLLSSGHKVFLFDRQNFEKSLESLFIWQKQGLDAVFVFNNSCFQMRLQSGESLWDLWKVPCFNILVDHPMYYFDTLDNAPSYGIAVCADRCHTEYIRRFYPTVQKAVFLPTAGECLKSFDTLKPFAERSIDVLFIGSYKYHTDIEYDDFAKQLETELISHPSMNFEQAVTACLTGNQQSLSTGDLKQLIQKYRFIDVNTTALFRKKIIEILLHAGIRITVYGNGWEQLELFHHPAFQYKGLIPPAEGIRLMEDSKIVLNHMAWFKAGASERIFEAMLQGAISLTDDSEYLRESFTDCTNIKYYSLDQLEALPEMVHDLLNNSQLTETIRANAWQQAVQFHTWNCRTQELLDIIP